MPDQTPVLQLPYILPSQAQKHVTHNEAIRLLDVIVQLSVTARNLGVPPASPVQGDRYIVAAGASGDWAGREGQIALFENTAWQFFAPKAGWTAWVTGEQVLAVFSGAVWTSQADGPFNVGQLGVSATPDTTNRLSVSSDATLLNHAGMGHQLKLNKALVGDTASLLFQTGFSGRAEMGIAGSDDFAIKVSADGASFVTGLSIEAATGAVTLPVAVRLGGQPSDPVSPENGTIWLNTTTGEVKVRSGGVTAVLAGGGAGLSDGDKGDIIVSAAGTAWVIDTGAVGNAKLANMPSGTFKGRLAGSAGEPQDITPAQAASLLPPFSAAMQGLAPASGGGTINFLRADGTWAAPASAGGGIGGLADLGVTASAVELNQLDGIVLGGAATQDISQLVPTGAVAHFAMSTAPAGWLKANGAAVSRTAYTALFAAIGTTYGVGDGTTTFNLPDLRGEFLRGWDDGRGVDAGRAIGASQDGTLIPNAYANNTPSFVGSQFGPAQNVDSSSPFITRNYVVPAQVLTTSAAFGAFTARPRNVALLACIKF